jgi:hypothetical protein
MGGRGSGRTAFFMVDKCENLHSIDLAWLRRQDMLRPGYASTIRWSRGGRPTGSVAVHVSHSGLRLTYRVRPFGGDWQDISEVIAFTESRTNFGGTRAWLQCLTCGRACRVLYGGTRFRCRTCLGLRYESQYEAGFARAASRVHKIRGRLGHYGAIDEPFPPKPKGMHWRTYRRLQEKDRRCAEAWVYGLAGCLRR